MDINALKSFQNIYFFFLQNYSYNVEIKIINYYFLLKLLFIFLKIKN